MTFFQYYYSATLYPFWQGLSWGQVKHCGVFAVCAQPKMLEHANRSSDDQWQVGASALLALLKCA